MLFATCIVLVRNAIGAASQLFSPMARKHSRSGCGRLQSRVVAPDLELLEEPAAALEACRSAGDLTATEKIL